MATDVKVVDTNESAGGLHPTGTAIRKMSMVNADLPQLLDEAKAATKAETEMSIRQAFKTYPKAVMLCFLPTSTLFLLSKNDMVYKLQTAHTRFLPHGKPASQTVQQ
jgi:hypothetical protein